MTLKMCGKKTYDPSGFSPEIFFYLNKNWQKYWQLESCHFFFDHTVDNYFIFRVIKKVSDLFSEAKTKFSNSDFFRHCLDSV